jgi:hypothetical protein
METPFECSDKPAAIVTSHGGSRPVAPSKLYLTRDQLDGRTQAAKLFDKLVSEIESDLGGRAALSTIERALVEAFVGAAVCLNSLNAQLALGQPIDLAQHAQAASVLVRIASRLGLSRRAREVLSQQQTEAVE